MSKLIVVIGVTGAQGGSVARTFLQFPDWRVRGITRNPSADAALSLAAAGVEIVQGDLDDAESLAQAFEKANVIFSNTDFFTHLFQAISDKDLAAGQPAAKYAYEREVSQGLNIAKAAASPSVLKTLERFVLSSLSEARKWSGSKHSTVYHFDSKAEMIRKTQERYPEVSARTSTIQMGHYVTNWKAFAKMAPQKQPDGSFIMSRTISPSFRMPHVVADRDTGSFVKAVVDLPPGKNLLAVSEYMSFPEWVDVWSRVLGVNAAYKQVSNDEFFENVPEALGEELKVSFDYIEEFGFTGGDPDVLEPGQLDLKIPVTSMEEYIKSEDWSSILNS